METKKPLLWLLAATALLMACEPPITTYRRSALTPSALGISAVAPLEDGEVEVSGSMSSMEVHTRTPEVGDPALHVSQINALGQLRVGLGDHWSLGGQLQGAHLSWSAPSADGTPPLKDGLAWGVGPNLSFHLGDRDGLSLGGSLALTWMSVPWATWELSDADKARCSEYGPDCSGPSGQPSYEYRDSGRESLWLYRAALGPHYQWDRFGFFAGLSAQNSLNNIGFDPEPQPGSTLTNDNSFWVSYLGASVRADSGLFLQTQLYLTHGDERTPFSPGFQLTLGMSL
jgi:hypothetical protein